MNAWWYTLTLEYRIGKHLMLTLALVKDFAAFLVVILDSKHFMKEVSIIILFIAIANCGRMILYYLFIFVLHQLVSALKYSAST